MAHRTTWIILVRTFDVHGIGRCRWLQAARDIDKLSDLMGLPVADVQAAIDRFEALGLVHRNGSGDVFVPIIFISMASLRRKWRRDLSQRELATEVSA